MSTTHHFCQSIRGALHHWTQRDWARATKWIRKDDGSSYMPMELKNAMLEELAKGHGVLPVEECDNFDYKKGCLGHPKP